MKNLHLPAALGRPSRADNRAVGHPGFVKDAAKMGEVRVTSETRKTASGRSERLWELV